MIPKLIFHLLSIANYTSVIYISLTLTSESKRMKAFGGQWKFLTFWNLWFQLIYFVVATFNDFTGSEEKTKKTSSAPQSVRDFLFATLAFPMGIFVFASFWVVFSIDRELIYPKRLDAMLPPAANHMMHSAPAICQLVELLISYHAYPSKLTGALTFGGICLIYIIWIFVIAHFGGFWVYPIFKVLPPVGRALFLAVCLITAAGLYLAGQQLNNVIWKKSVEQEEKKLKVSFATKKKMQKAD